MRHFLGKIKEGLLVSLSARSIISCGSNPSQSIIRICVPSNQVDRTAPSLQVQPPFFVHRSLFLSTHSFFVHPPPFFCPPTSLPSLFYKNKEERHSTTCRFRGCALRTRIHCLSATRNTSTTKDLNWFQEGNSNLFQDFYYSWAEEGGAAQKWLFTNQTLSYLHWQLHWYCHWHKLWFRDAFAILEMCTLLIIVCWSEILGKSHLLGYLKSIMTEEGTSCGWLTWLDQLRNWK